MEISRQSELIDRVNERLLNHEATADAGIQVVVEGQQAWLRGRVRSQAIKDEAEVIAKQTPGIMLVINELYVDEDADDDVSLRGAPPFFPNKAG